MNTVIVVFTCDLRVYDSPALASGLHPYWRAWSAAAWRQPCEVPSAIRVPADIEAGELPARLKWSQWAGDEAARSPGDNGSLIALLCPGD